MTVPPRTRPLGLWLVGARGAIGTCVSFGLFGLRKGLVPPTGLVTETEAFAGLPLADLEHLVLGGHEVSTRDLATGAAELVQAGILPAAVVEACRDEAAAFEARLRPGLLDDADLGGGNLDPACAERSGKTPREQVALLQADWDAFEEAEGLEGTVVVDLTSTEAHREPQPEWESLDAFEAALDAGTPQPASVLYAYAALASGRALVNFTPNRSSSLPALQQLAQQRGVVHAGQDGKTGETLLKTALAPMFSGRALKVLTWQGYNMLGNRDGAVLSDEAHKATKVQNKDRALRDLLGDADDLHTGVGIDFVPSLGDWKTAMDLVHFEGFLGARMTLQMTWTGSDSALAAPLVLDLVRLVDLAGRAGQSGALAATACFFKAPLTGGTHDFHAQLRGLLEWADGLR